MMMELKNWLKQNILKVRLIEELGISETSYNFINCENEDENKRIAKLASGYIDESITKILNSLLDKEGRRGD
jgi:predicted XRE-type DNA-binding protein